MWEKATKHFLRTSETKSPKEETYQKKGGQPSWRDCTCGCVCVCHWNSVYVRVWCLCVAPAVALRVVPTRHFHQSWTQNFAGCSLDDKSLVTTNKPRQKQEPNCLLHQVTLIRFCGVQFEICNWFSLLRYCVQFLHCVSIGSLHFKTLLDCEQWA